MRLLFVTPELPYPPDTGGNIRIYHFLQELAARHTVDLVTFVAGTESPTHLAALRSICDTVVTVPRPQKAWNQKRQQQLLSLLSPATYQFRAYYSPQMQAAIDAQLRRHAYDLVQVEYAKMGYFTLPPHLPSVLDQHNVEAEIMRRTYASVGLSARKLYSLVEWQKFRRDELAICRRFSLCLTTSDRDRRALSLHVPPERLKVIPNGVDSHYFRSVEPRRDTEPILLFSGTLDYFPNVDAVHFFMQHVLPLVRRQVPQIKFYIAGRNPSPEIQRYAQEPGVVVTGYVEDMRPYYRQASVVVTPLRVGGGTRLKILEALAMCRPVVSTTIGAEGLDVLNDRHLLLADDPAAYAQAIVRLLDNPALGHKLAHNGRRLIEHRYDWRIVTRQLERVYEGLLAGATHAPALDSEHSAAPQPVSVRR